MKTKQDVMQHTPPRIVRWLQNQVVQHFLLWLAAWVILMSPSLLSGYEFWVVAVSQLINLVFYMAIVYINIGFLIPTYLRTHRTIIYIGYLIAWAIILMPLKVLAMSFWRQVWSDAIVNLKQEQGSELLSLLVVALGSTVIHIITEWIRSQQERQELEQRNIQSELNFLKTQINPHFLFNTLNTLYALTLRKSDKAPEIVIKLSEMMRYMLYDCNEERVMLAKEVSYLHNYLDIEKLRNGDKVDVIFEVTGNISEQKIAPLMFIPFLENSFKHGLSNAISKGFVHCFLDVHRHDVTLRVINSKPERMPARDPSKRSGGIGLVNVRRRLSLLYPNAHTLEIMDDPDGFEVRLVISLDDEQVY